MDELDELDRAVMAIQADIANGGPEFTVPNIDILIKAVMDTPWQDDRKLNKAINFLKQDILDEYGLY